MRALNAIFSTSWQIIDRGELYIGSSSPCCIDKSSTNFANNISTIGHAALVQFAVVLAVMASRSDRSPINRSCDHCRRRKVKVRDQSFAREEPLFSTDISPSATQHPHVQIVAFRNYHAVMLSRQRNVAQSSELGRDTKAGPHRNLLPLRRQLDIRFRPQSSRRQFRVFLQHQP